MSRRFRTVLALDRQGRLVEALNAFVEALRIQPDSAKAHTSLGEALVRAGRTEEARAHFVEALRIDPQNVDARERVAGPP